MIADTEFSPKEEAAIKELRKRLKDEMEPELFEDSYLFYRFLKARDFNVNHAESMLKKNLDWRKEYDIQNITKWKISEVLKEYTAYSLLGYGKEGCVVRYCPIGNIDMIGIFASFTYEEFLKTCLYLNEEDTLKLKEQSIKLGRNVDKCIYIDDIAHFTFERATHKQTVYAVIRLAKLYQNNYPERVKAVYFINVSPYFSMIYSMVKPFIAKALLEKIYLYSDDSFKEDIKKLVDEEVLPAFLGGKRTDPDGNPMCRTFINFGGKIQKKYYLPKNNKILSKSPEAKKISLSRAEFQELVFEVKEPNSTLEWQFETKCRDIGFGLYYQDTATKGEENNVEIIPLQRINTDLASETGTFKCDKVGKYVIVFDNTYSWIRSKDVYYKIKVLTLKDQEAQMMN